MDKKIVTEMKKQKNFGVSDLSPEIFGG